MEAQSVLCPDLIRSFNACGDPVFVVDDRWTILSWNKSAEAVFGRDDADVLGKRCYEVIAGIEDAGREVCRVHCEKWALARRGARITNFDILATPLHDKWANVSILPISDASGRPVALAHVVRNVARTKRLERFVREIAVNAEDVLAPHVNNGVVHEPTPIHLTNRELEVLGLLAHGAGTMTIAERLGVSKHTVHNHIAVLLNKLGVHTRAEAVTYAFEHHLA
jgi:PAS domain S-box-containing protein